MTTDNFDNAKNEILVYNVKTFEWAIMWSRTWLGRIIFMEQVPMKHKLSEYDIVYDDMEKFKDFIEIGKL